MNFAQLTTRDTHVKDWDNKPIWINVDKIVAIYPSADGTIIETVNGNQLVKEHVDNVLKQCPEDR